MSSTISCFGKVPDMLDKWEEWSDSSAGLVAGFPKKSVIATISELRLTEHGDIPARPGRCPVCEEQVADLNWHIMRRHPEHDAETAKGRQTRASVYYSPDDNPIAESVEAAIVFMGQTRPDLFHVIVADRLWLVPRFNSEWEKRALKNPQQLQHIRREFWKGESEADHKKRLARKLGMGQSRYYELLKQAHTFLGVYLDLNKRYSIVPA